MTHNPNMTRTRHTSLEMPDPDVVKKKHHQDMLTKARNRLLNFGDALKTNKLLNGDLDHQKKSRTQSTLDYFFKPCPNKSEKNHVFENSRAQDNNASIKRSASLQKQNSVGAYPIKIQVSEDDSGLGRVTDLGDGAGHQEPRETAALALERPRKKLSFREPEISGYACLSKKKGANKMLQHVPELKRSVSAHNGLLKFESSWDDLHLESQAMRVVRTVGQAFEVCHKLSINAPDLDPPDQDEQDTLTQDLVSDRVSDIVSDKPKKDLLSETTSDRNSLPADEIGLDDLSYAATDHSKSCNRVFQPDVVSPPSSNSARKMNLVSGETYVSPLSEAFLTSGSGSGSLGNTTIFSTGSALSALHEIQLLKEQLEQQSQQTQAALAQLQLVREQLAAEQSARMEAQARTHQLLVHNKELLDHIAALVSHLQGGEKGSAQSHAGPHLAMPQQLQNHTEAYEYPENASVDQTSVYQPFQPSQGLIENRMATSCLPTSPLRTTFNPSGSTFNFSYPPSQDTSFEGQLMQRLQALGGYTPPQYQYNYQPLIQPNLYNPLNSTPYNLQPPPQKKLPHSTLAMMQSYTGSPAMERRISPGRNDYHMQQDQINQNQLQVNHGPAQRLSPQTPPQLQQPPPSPREPHFIKPLSQLGTLTTTDVQGRVRVIVPVPSRSPDDDAGNLLASLRLGDELRPTITRSTSEKVPNRSELMSQMAFVFVPELDQ